MPVQKWTKRWLVGFVILLLAMIAVGGVTRLTRSGLSIVEWRPFTGILPPLSDQAWQDQFELYKQSPEFQQVNSQFALSDYQRIFIWEYIHRLLGRFIFLYALLPGVVLWRKRQVKGSIVTLLCVLVALQGLIGWLMVKSGLAHEPHVSPFMLALHFFSALTVLATVYYQLSKFRPKIVIPASAGRVMTWVHSFGILLLIQLFYGCLTSGFKAGFSFNTYPLMGGEFFPPGGLLSEPFWVNFFVNPATIQWTHRWMGIVVFLIGIVAVKSVLGSTVKKTMKGPLFHLAGVCFVQVLLGILNVLFVVPIPLAVLHQLIASLLLMAYLNVLFRAQSEGS
jgi:cytochrome c oxidase assembly protein subunit 15